MPIKPEECLLPSEEDQLKFKSLCLDIDRVLKEKYTSKNATVIYRFESISERVKNMIVASYLACGWKVEIDNDIWSDMRGEHGGSHFFRFSA